MEGNRLLQDDVSAGFTSFVRDVEPRIRRALTAAFGAEAGRDATAEALAYGWEHWDRVGSMENPAGYLFRIAQRRARRSLGSRVVVEPVLTSGTDPWVEPELAGALSRLSERQRVVVSLLHAFDWSMQEVADLLDVSKGSVQTHQKRAMKKLKKELGVEA